MFDLERPCVSCPFRKGQGEKFRLPLLRLREIRKSAAFQCHKTVNYDEFDDDEKRQGDRPQQCAGLMAVLHREGEANQITQLAQRLTGFDPSKLDPRGEAYGSWGEVLDAHCGED